MDISKSKVFQVMLWFWERLFGPFAEIWFAASLMLSALVWRMLH